MPVAICLFRYTGNIDTFYLLHKRIAACYDWDGKDGKCRPNRTY